MTTQAETSSLHTSTAMRELPIMSAQNSLRVSAQPSPENLPEWTFLSNHGHVLVCLALDPQSRLRDIAARVGITERAVQGILRNLEDAGYVLKERVGRRNSYTVNGDQPFRHPLEARVPVGDFLRLITAQRR